MLDDYQKFLFYSNLLKLKPFKILALIINCKMCSHLFIGANLQVPISFAPKTFTQIPCYFKFLAPIVNGLSG